MDCDWIFVNADRTRIEATLQEPDLPQTGNGKVYKNKGYEVVAVVTNRITKPNPTVIAVEIPFPAP